jgi:hypothetical protein
MRMLMHKVVYDKEGRLQRGVLRARWYKKFWQFFLIEQMVPSKPEERRLFVDEQWIEVPDGTIFLNFNRRLQPKEIEFVDGGLIYTIIPEFEENKIVFRKYGRRIEFPWPVPPPDAFFV